MLTSTSSPKTCRGLASTGASMLGQAISHYRIPVAGARGRNRGQEPLLMLQGPEEIQDVLLLRRAERVEIVEYPVGLRATSRAVVAIVISIRDFAMAVGMRLRGLQYSGRGC